MSPQTKREEDFEYLKAKAILSMSPDERALLGGNGDDNGRALANHNEYLRKESQRQREERQRRERIQEWINHFDHMARQHLQISESYAQKRADLLRLGE